MAILDWIKGRLPSDHGFSDEHITEVLEDPEGANNIKELAVADLLEELASKDRYKTVNIGNTSYSDPLLMARAQMWRDRAPADTPGSSGAGDLSFVPIKGRTGPAYDEFGG